jgi:hypothetical protein
LPVFDTPVAPRVEQNAPGVTVLTAGASVVGRGFGFLLVGAGVGRRLDGFTAGLDVFRTAGDGLTVEEVRGVGDTPALPAGVAADVGTCPLLSVVPVSTVAARFVAGSSLKVLMMPAPPQQRTASANMPRAMFAAVVFLRGWVGWCQGCGWFFTCSTLALMVIAVDCLSG